MFVIRKAGMSESEDVETEEGLGWGDGGVGVLPECMADRMAVELGEPVGRSGGPASPDNATGRALGCKRSSRGCDDASDTQKLPGPPSHRPIRICPLSTSPPLLPSGLLPHLLMHPGRAVDAGAKKTRL